ncbi:MAG: hypothetical protein SFY68_10155 [Candidatus Sumerlaeia bacterium]|nr:hypothetical protein [Candidatus Sumerlaeia bacterium]
MTALENKIITSFHTTADGKTILDADLSELLQTKDNQSIVIEKNEEGLAIRAISSDAARQLAIAKRLMTKFRGALDELAK